MRRPLANPDGNGTPFFQLLAGDAVLFDASTLDSGSQWAVTVFAWFYSPTSPADVSIGINTPLADGTPVIVPTGIWLTAGSPIDAFRENGLGPARVLDRVVITGDQQVVIRTVGAYTAGVFWFGYVERVGRIPEAEVYRQLQPSNDLSAAPFPPVIITVPAGGGTVSEVVHALDNSNARYFDVMDVYVSAIHAGALAASPGCHLKVPGSVGLAGAGIAIPILDGGGGGPAGSPIHLYDGIPVRAPSIDDNLFELEVVGDDGGGADVTAVCYGRFRRSA